MTRMRLAYITIAVITLLFLPLTNGAAIAPAAAAGAGATQDGLLQLTSANWSTEIQHGAWLVEFFSPYCQHCKKFLPTWLELVANKDHLRTDYPDAPFTLAQVNCFAQQDICVSEKVPHVPRLSVYKDGVQMQGEFNGDREYTGLATFIDQEAADYRKKKGVSDTPHPNEGGGDAPVVAGPGGQISGPLVDTVNKVGIPDAVPVPAPAPAPPNSDAKQAPAAPAPAPPPVAPAAQPDAKPAPPAPATPATPPKEQEVIRGPNPHGLVLKFGKDEVVKDVAALKHYLSKEGGPDSTFVKFFASWCPHCKAMASAFVQVGAALQGRINVVEVDCEAYQNVCREYGIRSFPTLRMYNEGEATEYRGGRSFEAMRGWAINAGSASGVREISSNELEGLRNSDEVLFLYLHSPDTPEREIDAVTRASRVLLTTPVHVYRSTDQQLITRYRTRLLKGSASAENYSGLLVFKDHNLDVPTAAYYPSKLAPSLSQQSATSDVASWFDKERYPTVAEVTGSTFSDIIHNKQAAPVVLAALSDIHHSGRTQSTGSGSLLRDAELQDLQSLALAWRQRGGAIEGTAEEELRQRPEKVIFAWIDADRWATAIKKYYNIKAEKVPKLVLADGARLEYYSLPSHFVDPFTSKKKPWIENKEVFDTLDLIWQGKGPKPKSSRTYLQSTTGAIGALGMSVARHPLLSFCVASALFFALFSSMRKRPISHRLPHINDKAD